MMKIHGTTEAEVAVLISDKWQGRGLGKELLARLLIVGADEKLSKLTADILPDNREVMRICEKLGFTLKHSLDDEVVRAEFALLSSAVVGHALAGASAKGRLNSYETRGARWSRHASACHGRREPAMPRVGACIHLILHGGLR